MTKQIAISIPIELNNRQAIASTLWERYGKDYLFLGRFFQETNTQESCQIEISAPDLISNHTAINLISDEVGYSTCLKIARFVRVFLELGGMAVRVESAEITHSPDKWLNLYNSEDIFDIYSLFVGLVETEAVYYSCGMHNFGKPDVTLTTTEDIGLAIYVMNVFNYYRLTEFPILQDGHIFQPDIESPRYQMQLLPDELYAWDSYQFNPYGRWYLSRAIDVSISIDR